METKTEQAKDRCKGCFALIDKGTNRWWCDEGDCPVEDITKCDEWTDPGVGSTPYRLEDELGAKKKLDPRTEKQQADKKSMEFGRRMGAKEYT